MYRQVAPPKVHEEVLNVEVIDVHTHLLPPNHGKLMLWGIHRWNRNPRPQPDKFTKLASLRYFT